MNTKFFITVILSVILTANIAMAQKKVETITFSTAAQCEMCKERIEKELVYTKGIKFAELDMETKDLTVTYKTRKISKQEIKNIVLNLGYDVDGEQGNQENYQNLPKCCKKPEDR